MAASQVSIPVSRANITRRLHVVGSKPSYNPIKARRIADQAAELFAIGERDIAGVIAGRQASTDKTVVWYLVGLYLQEKARAANLLNGWRNVDAMAGEAAQAVWEQ